MDESAKERLLPGEVSSVTPQKRNKNRYSVFIDEEFLIGISESTLLDFDIRKGSIISVALFRNLQRSEGRNEIKSYLLKLLSRRDHARKELLDKAFKKDYSRGLTEDVLNELESKGYIDDEGFAEKFAENKALSGRWGPSKIRAHLYKKGLARATIDRAIDAAFGDLDVKEQYINLVLKKKRRFLREPDPFKRKKKIFDYLCRKGYKPGNIRRHIDELMEIVDQ